MEARPGRERAVSTYSSNVMCEFLEPRKLFAAVGTGGSETVEKLKLVHQELHRPPTALLTWGSGLAFRVATASHSTAADGRNVIGIDVYGNAGPTGDLKLISHTDCDDNDPAAAIYVAAGDVNGDGFTDIAVKLFSVTGQPTPVGEASNEQSITILTGDGKDNFSPTKAIVVTHVFDSRTLMDPNVGDETGIAIGDLDGDRVGDILSFTGDSGDVILMSARGPRQTVSLDGTFSHSTIKGNGRIAGIGDLDSDGVPDIVGFDADAPVVLYGPFDAASKGVKLVKRIEIEVTNLSGGIVNGGCVPCDLDGDGFTDDLVIVSNNNVFLGTNNSKTDPATGQTVTSFTWTQTSLPPQLSFVDVLVGDVNGDGKADLFTVTNRKHEFTGHVTLIK